MACPYFYPLLKADRAKQPARTPLGVLYDGRCELEGEGSGDACNFGYAAGRCETFPAGEEVDAVRFSSVEGQIIYVLEKDHSPLRWGEAASLEGVLARQAEVFTSWMIDRG